MAVFTVDIRAALFHCMSIQLYRAKLAVDESTQVDLLTADGEYLYTAAAAALTVCTALL